MINGSLAKKLDVPLSRDSIRTMIVSTATFIGKVRNVAQKLRAPNMDMVLKLHAKKGMVIDMPIRWGSTFNMIKRALELKETIKKMQGRDIHLTNSGWDKLERLKHILEIPHISKK